MKSLYIHIPFCLKKCLFCSFAISVGALHRSEEYIAALKNEMKNFKNEKIKTIYFGGGTPTMMNCLQISRILHEIKNNFDVMHDVILSIEANPESISADYAIELKQLGLNRVSLGVQTFDPTYLKFLGRAHDQQKALDAYAHLKTAGFDNINVDLMYGFPKQTRAELEKDLAQVVALKPQHVSLYTLTIEPNSRFHVTAVKLDKEEKLADDYVFVTEYLEKHGLKQYEVSNFAKPGFESTHNMVYWQGGDYIGLGMGAHGLVNGRRYANEDTLNTYLDAIKSKGHAINEETPVTPDMYFADMLIFGLRMNQGVNIQDLENKAAVTLTSAQQRSIDDLIQAGFLVKQDNRIKTTMQGRLVLDEIATRLI